MLLKLANAETRVLQYFRQNGIRIGAVIDPGHVEQCFFDKTIPSGPRKRCHPGMSVSITQLVLDVLEIPRNKRYYTAVNHTNYGHASGMVRHIWDGIFDVSVPSLAVTEERKLYVQYSTAIEHINYFIMSRYATMEDRSMFNSFAAFRPIIWILICCGALAIGAALSIAKRDWKVGSEKSGNLKTWCLDALDASGIYVGQGKLFHRYGSKMQENNFAALNKLVVYP